MTIQVSAFGSVPLFAQGYVRDLRVRWALEEAGFPYEPILINAKDQMSASYRQWQPFGQVPAYRDDQVEMFESGAIVLYLAAQSEALSPKDAAGRARVYSWVLAALNSIEPHAQNLIHFDDAQADTSWAEERRTQLATKLIKRLAALSDCLDDRDFLDERFTAGDLIMTTVLRELVDCGALSQFAKLDDYRRRCEARPAFGRALEAQMQPFRENASIRGLL